MAVILAATLVFQIGHIRGLPQIKASYQPSGRVILDRNGAVLDEIRGEAKVRRLAWVELARVSPQFLDAVTKAENDFFYNVGARVADMIGTPGFTKVLGLELAWSKREILEAYINLVRFRSDIEGIGAASFLLFDKTPANLNRVESAVLAAMIQSPRAGVNVIRKRACELLEKMNARESCSLLAGNYFRNPIKLAPHLTRRLMQAPELKNESLVRSTLDRQVQWVALNALQKRVPREGAALIVENSTGNVLAYVGTTGPSKKRDAADGVTVPHQVGSTLKPLIYGKAFDERVLTAATPLEDSVKAKKASPRTLKTSPRLNRSIRDLVSVRNALIMNLNIPAVKALDLLGVETFVQTLSELGFSNLGTSDDYGPSLALGTAEARLLDLTNAYRSFANSGTWSPLRFAPDIPSEHAARRVYSPEAAYIVSDILSAKESLWSAYKVSINKESRESWAIGYSEKYTVGVWIANSSAHPVWREIMDHLHRSEESHPPKTPDGLILAEQEVFIRGTEPLSSNEPEPVAVSKISYPKNKAVIEMENESSVSQPTFIQIVAPKSDQNVYLNGRRLGRAKNFIPWTPQIGKYVLHLRDSRGHVVHQVRFEVRGRRFAFAN